MEKKKGKTLITVKRIIVIGNAMGISLDKEWLKINKLKKGDRVIIKVEPIK